MAAGRQLKPRGREQLLLILESIALCPMFFFRALFKNHLDGTDLDLIRKAAHYSQPVGDDRSKKAIEKMYGITLGQSRRGRPSLKEEEVVKI